jgi:hypothetical protein
LSLLGEMGVWSIELALSSELVIVKCLLLGPRLANSRMVSDVLFVVRHLGDGRGWSSRQQRPKNNEAGLGREAFLYYELPLVRPCLQMFEALRLHQWDTLWVSAQLTLNHPMSCPTLHSPALQHFNTAEFKQRTICSYTL